jgi:hypothetical protein
VLIGYAGRLTNEHPNIGFGDSICILSWAIGPLRMVLILSRRSIQGRIRLKAGDLVILLNHWAAGYSTELETVIDAVIHMRTSCRIR